MVASISRMARTPPFATEPNTNVTSWFRKLAARLIFRSRKRICRAYACSVAVIGSRRLRPGGPSQQESAAKQQHHNAEAGEERERYAGFISLEHGLSSFSALRARRLAHRPKARRRMS